MSSAEPSARNAPDHRLRIAMVGSRYFGATVFAMLAKQGVEIVRVIVPVAPSCS